MGKGPWRVVEHVNDCCFRDIYKGGLWEDDLYVSAQKSSWRRLLQALSKTYRNLHCLPVVSWNQGKKSNVMRW